MLNFDEFFERVIGHEGNFQAHYADRANWTSGRVGVGKLKGTKFGLSAMTYPDLDIKNLSIEDAKEIYKNEWWDKFKMEYFPPAIAYQMFDAAINHGMIRAVKMLQRAVGVVDDGVIGEKTKLAIEKADLNDVLLRFLAERLLYMTNLTTWGAFGKGWARRIAHNMILASRDN